MAEVKIDRFLSDFLNELESHNAAIFAGAGLSVPAGFVDWKKLLQPLAEDLCLDVEQEDDLVSLAQYHVTAHGNSRVDLNQRILNEFSRGQVQETESHRILARLPIQTYWTTNYDTVIESSLKTAGKIPEVKYTVSQLPHSLRDRDATVYKMHGDVTHPNEAVITKADYETFHISHAPFLAALAGDLISKTFLFLGFSFTDPHLQYVLSRLRVQYGDHQKKHYCILKRESARPEDRPGDLEYRKTKQALFINDLLRYSIRCVMVDTYDEITLVLSRLEKMYKQRTVFISGAAAEYGAFRTSDDALTFVHDLGKRLIAADQRIVSGLGLGIGATLIDGALTEIYQVQKRSLKDQLVIRPFPQSLEGRALWKKYREDMLDYAGIAIFMFGNKKLSNGSVILSNGMREEFEIAASKGVRLLPLGFTGYMAKELWHEIQSNKSKYYPNAPSDFMEILNQLGDETRPIFEYVPLVEQALHALKIMG